MRLGKNTQGAGVWGLTGGPPGVQPPLVPRWMGSPCRRASTGSAPWLPSTLHVLSLTTVIRSVDLLSLLTSLPHSPPAPQCLLRQRVDGLSHSFSAVSPEHVLPVLVEETENYTIIITHEKALYEGSTLGVFYQLVARKTSASSVLGRLLCPWGQQWGGSDADCPSEGWHLRTGGHLQGMCWSWCRVRQLWKQGSWSSASSTRNQNERKRKEKWVDQQCNHKGAYFLMWKALTGRRLWAPGPLHTCHSLAPLLCPPLHLRLHPQRHLWPRVPAGALAGTS